MANEELDALIVRNMRQARLAYERLEFTIGGVVERELDRAFDRAMKRLNWRGAADWNDEGLWLSPPEWAASEAGEGGLARFTFDADGADGEDAAADHLWLVTLCQEGRGRYGLRLDKGDGLGMKPGQWKKHLNGHSAVPRLVVLGFLYDDRGHFFRPVDFTAEALALAIETDDYSEFMRPLDDAVTSLPEAAAAFDEILTSARAAGA